MGPANRKFPFESNPVVYKVMFSADWHVGAGASTPYKRWSKYTMEKVGEAFLQKLRGGSALIINALPPKFLKIVATRGDIFSLKFTKYRLAAAGRAPPGPAGGASTVA